MRLYQLTTIISILFIITNVFFLFDLCYQCWKFLSHTNEPNCNLNYIETLMIFEFCARKTHFLTNYAFIAWGRNLLVN